MKTNVIKLHSLVLAVLLQFSPLLKFLQSTPALANSPIAIVLKWATAAAVMWGGFHAVSGASTAVLITSPTNSVATNGTAYRYTITTSDTKTDTGHTFTASPRPDNLTLTVIQGGVPAIANITGTPTNFGVWLVHLTACHEITTCAVPTNMLLTVYGKPIITNQPVSVTNSTGANASFTVVAGALPLPTYRWRLGTTTLASQTNATLSLTNINAGDAGNYTVVVSNFLGSITSAVAILTVASGAGPSIISQPHDATALIGGTTNFFVMANGTPPLTYFWRKNGNPIAASDATNFLANISTNDAGAYSVLVSNSINSVTSSAANLYVVRVPTITSFAKADDLLSIGFLREAGAGYDVSFTPSVPTNNWQVLTNFPFQTQSTNVTAFDSVTNAANRFYELRMTIPW